MHVKMGRAQYHAVALQSVLVCAAPTIYHHLEIIAYKFYCINKYNREVPVAPYS